MDSPPLRIIIVGAGIVGLSLSIMLRKAGHHVEIYEKSKFSQEVGVAIAMGPNAMRGLLSLGLDPKKARAVDHLQSKLFWKDKTDGDPDSVTGKNLEETYGTAGDLQQPYYFFHRVDLHNELKKLATAPSVNAEEKPVEIHLGSPVVSCATEEAIITLKDGRTIQGDLIIGADGINSTIRRFVLGQEIDPQPSNSVIYRSVIPFEKVANNPIFTWITKLPEAITINITFLYIHAEKHIRINERIYKKPNLTVLENISSPSSTEDWLETFSDFAPRYLEFIKLTTSVTIWPFLIWDELPTWTNKRVCILGDAAHAMFPTLAQGAAQGIEDAIVLGTLLPRGTPNNRETLAARLKLFESLRKPRASKVQTLSNRPGRGLPRANLEGELEEWLYRYDAAEEARKALDSELLLHLAKL
ncbi:FAD/NAD(P)-binding domain-containing protein [Sistotremastrum suecicum HHB10207 ss-3]|uniref:FAD/NAD(P)-binding domain-containing protein n=1 Tax=Sistotremastrum suecicum HHB10207 ss-3 TaxID=1314776 RepID=A0A166B8W3_9AGAM|nr:FAD/NAD(P)-binding domain-containing protein [Sistotremastrum suecicum HHB10207 ss-3]